MRIDMAASQVKFAALLSTEIDHMNKSPIARDSRVEHKMRCVVLILVMHLPPGMAADHWTAYNTVLTFTHGGSRPT